MDFLNTNMDNNHLLHNHSQGEILNSPCHRIWSPNNHLLSNCSLNLEDFGKREMEAKQGLRKSLSASVCQAQLKRTVPGGVSSSVTDSEITPTARALSGCFPPGESMKDNSQSNSHFFSVDQPPSSAERMCMRFSRPPGHDATLPQKQDMEGLGGTVQRSLSDLTCNGQPPSLSICMESKATYPAARPNGCGHVSADNRVSSDTRHESDCCQKDQDVPCHVIPAPGLPRDQSIPPHVFDLNIVLPSLGSPGDHEVYHTTVLAPDHFPDQTMPAQHGISNRNFSAGPYPPGTITAHNGTPFPYNTGPSSLGKVEGTDPAYGPPFPTASLQLTPKWACPGKEPINSEGCQSLPAYEAATLPKLTSSASGSSLDANGEQVLQVQPSAQARKSQEERKATYVVWNSHQDSVHTVTKTAETWTMTSLNEISQGLQTPLDRRDVEVQTLMVKECRSVATSPLVWPPARGHVFPEVNLKPEAQGEKSPMREVRWDKEGMTWEVYGATVDPEELGLAIQKHLEVQLEQVQTELVELSGKSAEELPVKEEKRTPFAMMMHCLRNPSCCARSSLAVE